MLPIGQINDITERVEKTMGPGKGVSILVHVGTHNAEREDTTAIVRRHRQLGRTLKQAQAYQKNMSGILPVIGSRVQGEIAEGWKLTR